MNNSIDDFRKRFDDLGHFIENAIHKADLGEVQDLGSLEDDVFNLCREVRDMDSEDAQDLGPLIADLISKMDHLAMALASYQRREQKLYD